VPGQKSNRFRPRCTKYPCSRGPACGAGPAAPAVGLVFIGPLNDDRFRAIDSKSGKELWSAKLDATANANPMTYEAKDGKQYVAVVAGLTLSVFTLP